MKAKGKITIEDYIKANRRASREEEIRLFGHPLPKHKVHKSKRAYDRKKIKAGDRNLPFSFSMFFNKYFAVPRLYILILRQTFCV